MADHRPVPGVRRRAGEGDAMTRCAACHADRPTADLLLVVDVAPPHGHRFVCRPSRPLPFASRSCFRSVGPYFLERIELAVSEPPLLPRPVPARPAPEPAPVVPFRPGRVVAAGVPDIDEMRWGAWR
jgi:hypothetical protein